MFAGFLIRVRTGRVVIFKSHGMLFIEVDDLSAIIVRHHFSPELPSWPDILWVLHTFSNLARKPFQDVLCEHAGGSETGSMFHQIQKHFLPLLGDGGKAFDIDHEGPTI